MKRINYSKKSEEDTKVGGNRGLMKMIKYRISKCNPIYRDEDDVFQKVEWTSVSDIGKRFNDKELSKEEYLVIEKKYIEVLKIIMQERGIGKLVVKDLEKEFTLKEICEQEVGIELSKEEKELFHRIKEDYELKFNDVDVIIKLLLRELLWCNLFDTTFNHVIEFGYEYYMYVLCSKLSNSVINKIQDKGLFIEKLKVE